MKFKAYNQGQSLLLPKNYGDFLGESHEAVVLNEFVNELDTAKLERSYKNENGGSSAYHPVMLLNVLVYGYMNGVFSSRKIAKQLKQDLAFMYLAGNSTPDFRTLARFRKDKKEELEDFFVKIIEKAYNLGLIRFGICSIDGTKIYANASKEKNITEESLTKKIKGFLKQADEIDEMEDEKYGDQEDEIDPNLKTKEGREKKKREIEAKKKKAEKELEKVKALKLKTKTTKINTTDADSKYMIMKKKDFANGYNVQIISENGIILSSSIFNDSPDLNTLIPSVKKLQKVYQKTPQRLLADKGYSSTKNYEFCKRNNIDAYIPVSYEQVDLTKYKYDSEKDTYTDKKGRLYVFKQYMERKRGKGKKGRPKKTELKESGDHLFRSKVYQHIDEKTQKNKTLKIFIDWQKHIKKQKEKLRSWAGRQIYKIRKSDVEGIFGNTKGNKNFNRFRLRGFDGVTSEWTLMALAHNIGKML